MGQPSTRTPPPAHAPRHHSATAPKTPSSPSPTSLDPLQTSGNKEAQLPVYRDLSADVPTVIDLLGVNIDAQKALADAYAAAGATEKKCLRIRYCGSDPWLVQDTADPTHYAIRADDCGCRYCHRCGPRLRYRRLQMMADIMRGQRLRFLTLTRRSPRERLKTAIAELKRAFKRLRKSEMWRENVKGCIAVLEVKHNPDTNSWHVHYHCLITGHYMPQARLSDLWLAATGDSPVVDIRAVRDTATAVRYVAKYLAKGSLLAAITTPTAVTELLTDTVGVRDIERFGSLRRNPRQNSQEPKRRWKIVKHLSAVIRDAAEGSMQDLAMLQSLPQYHRLHPAPTVIAPAPTPCHVVPDLPSHPLGPGP